MDAALKRLPRPAISDLLAGLNPRVFAAASCAVAGFVAWGVIDSASAAAMFDALRGGVARRFGWFYMLVVAGCLAFSLSLLATPARRIRLGGAAARPEFGRGGWFAMLFAAGMGVGLVYFGAGEPLAHFLARPTGAETDAAAAIEAIRLSFFHWGLSAWGVYVVFALAIAHAHFNRGLPLAPRAMLEPLIGDRHRGPIGDAADALCLVGAVLGVATSLGLGAMQISASLSGLTGAPDTPTLRIGIVALVSALAALSAARGMRGGVRRFSQINIALAGALLLAGLAVGLLGRSVELFLAGLARYAFRAPIDSLALGAGRDPEGWRATWTLFFWGWWIAWAPFVAIFVARISKGRTIGEVVTGALLGPTLVVCVWIAAFGGTAIGIERGRDERLIEAARDNAAASLEATLSALPYGHIGSALAIAVIGIFFVTSADSGALVEDMTASGGNPEPPRARRVFWACAEGAVAAVLLLMGGLEAIRSAAITLGLPVAVLLVAAAVALHRALKADPARN